MTVNEMHIAVNLGVQKIASFQVDNLLPQEIDHELNLSMIRFIKQRYNSTSNRLGKGFEQSQKRIDDLRTLVVEHTGFTNYEGLAFNSNYSDIFIDRYTFPLDYLFLVSVRGNVDYACNDVATYDSNTISYNMVRVELTPPVDGYVLTGVERWNSTSSLWELVTNNPLGEEIVYESLINSETYNFGITPASSFPDQASLGTTVHISPVLNSNHLYLNSPSGWSLSSTASYIREIWCQPGNMATAVYIERDYIRSINKTYRSGTNTVHKISLCKFAQHDDIIVMLDDPFNRTDYRTPLYTIEENYIDLHTDEEFVVPEVTIKYIRRPDSISITNGVGCELPEHTHNEIVEMTIKSILEGIQDPRYQTQTMETFESE